MEDGGRRKERRIVISFRALIGNWGFGWRC